MLFIAIVLLVSLVCVIGISIKVTYELNKLQNELRDKNDRIEDYRTRIHDLSQSNEDLQDELYCLKPENDVKFLKLTIEFDKVKNELENCKRQISDYESNQIQEAQVAAQFECAKGQLNEAYEQLTTANEQLRRVHEEIDAARGTLDLTKSEMAKLDEEKTKYELTIQTINNQINECTNTLNELKILHSKAVELSRKEEDETRRGLMVSLTEDEERLYSMVESICKTYPELSIDLITICLWKKIWMKRIQGMVKGGVSGIYKLTRISDGMVYIGQAVDIKDRWYQHVKKMIGIDKKGNEKLYEGVNRPDGFRWEVLDEGADKNWLNEREKFWIDFYNSVVCGLNSKR